MHIRSAKPGDIFEVDKKGRKFLAYFKGRRGIGHVLAEDKEAAASGELLIMPVDHSKISYRACTPREVIGHYPATTATRRAKGHA